MVSTSSSILSDSKTNLHPRLATMKSVNLIATLLIGVAGVSLVQGATNLKLAKRCNSNQSDIHGQKVS